MRVELTALLMAASLGSTRVIDFENLEPRLIGNLADALGDGFNVLTSIVGGFTTLITVPNVGPTTSATVSPEVTPSTIPTVPVTTPTSAWTSTEAQPTPPPLTTWTDKWMDKEGKTVTSTKTEYDCECMTTYITTVTEGKPCTSTIVYHTKKSSTMYAYTDTMGMESASSSYYSANPTPVYTPEPTPDYTPPPPPPTTSTTPYCVPTTVTQTVTDTVTMTMQMMCTPSAVYQTSTPSTCFPSSKTDKWSQPSSSSAAQDSWGKSEGGDSDKGDGGSWDQGGQGRHDYTTSYPGMSYARRCNDGGQCQATTLTVYDSASSSQPAPTSFYQPSTTACEPTVYTSTTMVCSTSTMMAKPTSTGKSYVDVGAAPATRHRVDANLAVFVASTVACLVVVPYVVMRI
ncbi:hypothetical protein ACQY0O_008247 [Thecaphora frezii]